MQLRIDEFNAPNDHKRTACVSQHFSSLFSLPSIAVFVFFLFLSTTSSLWAQIEIGRLAGTVTDPSGARVARAEVSLDNPLTGRQLRTSSDTQGKFRIENIPYGAYILRVTASGFGTSAQDVNVRSTLRCKATLS